MPKYYEEGIFEGMHYIISVPYSPDFDDEYIKQYWTLFHCLYEMSFWVYREGLDYALNRLLNEGQIANNDYYGWELARWSEHYLSWDIHGNEITEELVGQVNDNDYLAWLDPNFFDTDKYWRIYSEEEVRQAIHRMSEYWLREMPGEQEEYLKVLQKYNIEPWDISK